VTLALHWFRSDLRVLDNTALHAAAASGPLLALYVATPGQWRRHDDAAIKLDYWRRNLQQLELQLESLGIPLLYAQAESYADVPGLLQQLLPALGVSTLHCNHEYPLFEQRRDAAVAAALRAVGVAMQLHDDQTLQPPQRVLNKSGQPFKVFTPYAKALRELLQREGLRCLSAPAAQPRPVPAALPQLRTLQELEWPAARPHWEQLWPAGAEQALRQLQHFVAARVDSYKQQRDFPGLDGSSKLSPQLASGVLSVRQCWLAALAAEPGEGVSSWQNELLWRDFYKQVLYHFPRVSKGYNWREDLQHIPWRHDEGDFARWCEGRTGIPVVDAAMRQLLHTGWMHNRLRMITAMFLSKQLLIDWRWGERWFMQHLVDGDFAANNGGWQWSASTGTDAVPYFRIFNPVTQSRRFDPAGDFLRLWLPELAALDHHSIHEPGLLRPAGYPAAMVDLAFARERALNAFRTRD
jgi:deoxyribodipyrimidine photo-lyase